MTVGKTSTAQLIAKPLQYLAETTEGSLAATGTMIAFGINSIISIKKDGQWVEVPQLGPEDIAGLVQGPQKFPFQIKYTPVDSNFLQIAVKSANYGTPAGTISTSVSIVLAAYFNGTLNYITFLGCRPAQVQIDVDTGKPTIVTVDMVCMSISAPSSSAPTGVTLTSTFLTTPAFTWLSGGANPVSYNSVGQDCKKFSITINRNTKEDYTLGNIAPFGTQSHGRRIAFSMDCLWDGKSTFEADQASGTAQTIAVVLLSATSTLTLTSAQVTNYNRDEDVSSDMAIVESVTGKAISVTVT